jgi:hypothetical protein
VADDAPPFAQTAAQASTVSTRYAAFARDASLWVNAPAVDDPTRHRAAVVRVDCSNARRWSITITIKSP